MDFEGLHGERRIMSWQRVCAWALAVGAPSRERCPEYLYYSNNHPILRKNPMIDKISKSCMLGPSGLPGNNRPIAYRTFEYAVRDERAT
jgi:hypothetical protein